MNERMQWGITLALLAVYVSSVTALAWLSPNSDALDRRLEEFAYALQERSADWTVHEPLEPGSPLPPQDQRMRRAGLDTLVAKAPMTDDVQVRAAAFLFAFGGDDELDAFVSSVREPTAAHQAVFRLLRGDRALPGDAEYIEGVELPTGAKERLMLRFIRLNRADEAPALAEVLTEKRQRLETRMNLIVTAVFVPALLGLLGLFAIVPVDYRLREVGEPLAIPTPYTKEWLLIGCATLGWLAIPPTLGSFAMAGLGGDTTPSTLAWATLAITTISHALGLVVVATVAMADPPLRFADLRLGVSGFGGGRAGWARAIAWGLAGWCLSRPLLYMSALVSEVALGPAPMVTNPIVPILTGVSSEPAIIAIWLTTACVAPLFEELLFRGALFHGLRNHLGPIEAGAIVSAGFALVHPSPHTALYLFCFSAIACWLTERTGSLVPAVVLHSANNAASLFILSNTLAPGL